MYTVIRKSIITYQQFGWLWICRDNNKLLLLLPLLTGLVAWRSGNALCPINEVALCQAGLVLGWLTVCRQVNHLGMQPAA